MSDSTTQNNSGSGRTLAVAVTVSILTLLLLLLAAVIFLRRRRLQHRHQFRISAFHSLGSTTSLNAANNSMTTSSSHQNHRIVPFGMPGGETPRFLHTPGQNMRIATRRLDGAWDFGDSRAPFTPGGIRDLENTPSPSPYVREMLGLPRSSSPNSEFGLSPNGPGTAFQFPPPRRSSSPLSTTTFSSVGFGQPTSYTKEREAKRERERNRKSAFDEYEPNSDVLPPPAYVYGHPRSDPYSPSEGGYS